MLPADSWICPKMCNFGFIIYTCSLKNLQPTCTEHTILSKMPKGGLWVTKISIFYGRFPHMVSPCWSGYVKPMLYLALTWGDPNIFNPSTSTSSWLKKVHICFSFYIYSKGFTLSFGLTSNLSLMSVYLCKLGSTPKSWFPGITILCLYGKATNHFLNLSNSLALDFLVKSPACIKISASGNASTSSSWYLSCVSEIATILIFLFLTSYIYLILLYLIFY